MKEHSKPHFAFCRNKFWSFNPNSVWLGSTISLYRNIEKFNFPAKISIDRGKQIVNIAGQAILEMEGMQEAYLVKVEDLTALEKEFLVEHFLTSQSFHDARAGEGFVLEDSGKFIAVVNFHNHIHLEGVTINGDLENEWARLVKVETALGSKVSFAYSTKYGFLTADPGTCGTALVTSVFLQLSGLIHTEVIDDVLERLADENIAVTGIQGSPTEIIGDVIVAQNNYTLGITEENILSIIRTFTTKILVEEQAARNKIKQDQSPAIKDKISRAYAILVHSYRIEAVEALNAISLLKLGIDLGWIHGVSLAQLNQLFFNCRRAHLLCQCDKQVPQEEIPHKRAEFIHKNLRDVKLLFD